MRTTPHPRLYPVQFFPATLDLTAPTYESDARGGYHPIDPEHRGAYSFLCPHTACGKPLVWDVSQRYLGLSHFQCPACHQKSSGNRKAKGIIADA
jgi:hypothetical protein